MAPHTLLAFALVLVALCSVSTSPVSPPHIDSQNFLHAITECTRNYAPRINMMQHLSLWCGACCFGLSSREMGYRSHPLQLRRGPQYPFVPSNHRVLQDSMKRFSEVAAVPTTGRASFILRGASGNYRNLNSLHNITGWNTGLWDRLQGNSTEEYDKSIRGTMTGYYNRYSQWYSQSERFDQVDRIYRADMTLAEGEILNNEDMGDLYDNLSDMSTLGAYETLSEDTDPISEDTDPFSEDTDPESEDTDPISEDTDPYSEDTDPISEDTDPFSEDTDPESEDTDPLSEDTDPESEDTDPEGEDTDPEGEDTDPLSNGLRRKRTGGLGSPNARMFFHPNRCNLYWNFLSNSTTCMQTIMAWALRGQNYTFTDVYHENPARRCTRAFFPRYPKPAMNVATGRNSAPSWQLDKCHANTQWCSTCWSVHTLPMFSSFDFVAGPGAYIPNFNFADEGDN